MASMISGVLNANGRFTAAAAAPVLLNLLFIVAMGLGRWQGWDLGLTLAWATPVTGVAQLALVWWDARRTGYTFWPHRPRLTPDMRRLIAVALPAAFAGGVVQINLLVGRQVGSRFEGAIAWLSYSDRLYQLPLGVVGAAVAVVLLPELARRIRAEDHAGGQSAYSRATEFGLFLTLPSAFAIAVIAEPMVSTLFERGAFTAFDTQQTAAALIVYAIGLPAFVLQKILQPLYFAREDTRTPFRFAVISMVVNAVAAFGLMPIFGFLAAALERRPSRPGSWRRWPWWGTRSMGQAARADARLRRSFPRILLASALMAAVLWATRGWLEAAGLGRGAGPGDPGLPAAPRFISRWPLSSWAIARRNCAPPSGAVNAGAAAPARGPCPRRPARRTARTRTQSPRSRRSSPGPRRRRSARRPAGTAAACRSA